MRYVSSFAATGRAISGNGAFAFQRTQLLFIFAHFHVNEALLFKGVYIVDSTHGF